MISYRNESFPPSPSLVCNWLGPHTELFPHPCSLLLFIGSTWRVRSGLSDPLPIVWTGVFPSAASRRRAHPRLTRRPGQNNSQSSKHGRGEWDYRSRGCAWNGPLRTEGDRFPFRTWLKAVWWRESTFAINSWERRTPGHVPVLKLSGLYWKEAIFPSV